MGPPKRWKRPAHDQRPAQPFLRQQRRPQSVVGLAPAWAHGDAAARVTGRLRCLRVAVVRFS
jgi:hypothetical protein